MIFLFIGLALLTMIWPFFTPALTKFLKWLSFYFPYIEKPKKKVEFTLPERHIPDSSEEWVQGKLTGKW